MQILGINRITKGTKILNPQIIYLFDPSDYFFMLKIAIPFALILSLEIAKFNFYVRPNYIFANNAN